MDCIFCKIVAGELPCYKIYENDEFLAFLDIMPRNKGHVLVIPKKHVRWVWDVDNIGAYYEVVGKIANALRKSMKTDWIVSTVFGEEVEHAHVWLVPRYDGDGHGGSLKIMNIKKIDESEMKQIASKIVRRLL